MNSKVIAFIKNIEEYFIAATLGVMGIIMVLQVFCRYVLRTPLVWSEEIIRFLFIWVTFIGVSYTAKLKGFIILELFVNKLPLKVRKVISIFNNVIIIALIAMLIPAAYKFMMGQSSILSTGAKIPMSFVFAAVPIGFSLLIVRMLINTYEIIKGKDKSEITINENMGR